jgi:hypothetical protein
VPAESGGRERLIYIKAGDPDARPALALLNPEQLIGQRKVLVCDLSPDQQQSGAAAALEHQLLLKLRAFALQREQRPAGQRLPLYIYINEGFAEIPNDIEAIFDKPEQCHIYLTLCQQPPPQDQGEAWTRTLARLTRTQFTGYCGDASSYRRLGEISRIAPRTFASLQPYQWLMTHTGEAAEAGRRPPLLLTLSPAMADQHREG